jgi:hypothetical protein
MGVFLTVIGAAFQPAAVHHRAAVGLLADYQAA